MPTIRALSFAPGTSPIVAQQPREVADQQCKQQNAAGDVDRENDILQAVEIVRFLYGLREQKQRAECQRDTGDRDKKIDGAFYRSSGHSNHSLCNCHSPRQKNSSRSVAGYCSVLSMARKRTR